MNININFNNNIMRKILLSMAAVLMSLAVSAQEGITVVGANIPLLPSARWSKVPYTAKVLVINSGYEYGDYSDQSGNYNMELLEDYSVKDTNGKAWYEKGYDLTTTVPDEFETTEEGYFKWEDQTAPFSSDENWNGMKSFQWTKNNIIADIFIRRTFTTNKLLAGDVYLACGHDDAPCEYYLNGVLIWQKTGYEVDHYDYVVDEETGDTLSATPRYKQGWNNDEYYKLTDEQKELILTNGEENLLACHVHQNWGGAFADCGLYTMLEGGLDMGYVRPWEGKVIFNNTGGYNNDGASPSNNPKHPWSALYKAQKDDVYSFVIPGSSSSEDENYEWKEQLHFKTPIALKEGEYYNVKFNFEATSDFSTVRVKICDNDNDEDEATLYDDSFEAMANTSYTFEEEIEGKDLIKNLKLVFDFGDGEENATIKISNISITDGDSNDLWDGSQFFTYFDMHKRTVKLMVWDDTLNDGAGGYREAQTDEEKESYEYEEISYEAADAPVIDGLTETMDWTLPDFDDSMWDSQMMPTGSAGYMPEQQSVWPSGIGACYGSSNYWIRRNFELDKINDRLSYELNVCHDDVYETYVNGVRLQKNVGWTDGKHPVQVHIPARYLRVGKNVIATYIQQNWGGYFYDCGINVTEVDINECTKLFNDAVDYAKTDTLLTNRMHKDVDAIIAKAQQFYNENKNDAAELRSFARDSVRPQTNAIFAYSAKVKTLKDTYDICAKLKDNGYWGTALTDAVAALDTCATSGQLDPYITALRNGRKAVALERHTEKYKGAVPEVTAVENAGITQLDDPELPRYYIYNVGAKLFLGGGESWGAHSVLEYASNPMMLVQAMQGIYEDEELVDEEPIEGAFYIETYRPNGALGANDFLGWNGFVDVGMGDNKWEIIPVEGKPNVFNIAQYGTTFAETDTTCYNGTIFQPGGKKLLGLRSGDNNYSPSYYIVDTDMHSPQLETNQWMFITREEMLSFVSEATPDNPVDLTFLIENPGYDQRLSIDAWMFHGGNVWGRGDNHQNFVLESYNSEEFNNVQEIWPEEAELALPAGTYKLTVQGYYRDGIEKAHVEKVLNHEPISQRSFIFAGSDSYENNPDACEAIPLMPIHIEANKVPGIGYTYGGMSMPGTYSGQPMSACEQAANEYFQYGLYKNELNFIIPEDDPGHLSLGVVKVADETRPIGDWIVMDNWRLWYLGSESDPDAIGDVIKTPVKSTKTIFNLSGQQLNKVQKGVNIINGKKVLR